MRIKSITKKILDEPKQYYDVINADPYNNFLIKTESGFVGSHNCFFDEISFVQNQDVAKQKEKAKALVNTAAARMQSRFMKGEVNPTLLCLASSKRTEQSFMETWIQGKKQLESDSVLIVDEPQWVIRTDKDSPNKFKVAVGSKYLSSEVLPLNITEEEVQRVRDRGYTIIDVPMGYYENFVEDIDIALTDIAGISTTNSNRYISGPRITASEKEEYTNAFTKEIIEVGNAPEDTAQYSDFFDISRIPEDVRSRPLFIHLDMSLSGDKTGIAGVFATGKKPPKEGEPVSKELMMRLGFHIAVKAPRGFQVSFEKNRNFIRWLRQNGFSVKGVSCDTYQSADLMQALKAEHFEVSTISVDRVDTDRICKPYQYLRNSLYEGRLGLYKSVLLKEELIGLERDNNSGKIDHSPAGVDSKDTADAVCGAVWNASLHAEELVIDFVEDIEVTMDTNYEETMAMAQEQIVVSFEDELKKAFTGVTAPKQNNSSQVDFGMGPATTYDNLSIYDGVFVW